MEKPKLLPRMIAYLAQTPDEWITEGELRAVALRNGYTGNHIKATLDRLRVTEHIGSLWSGEKREVTFRWYPPSPDSEFRQNAIDNF
jgi:hypothetical protein